MTENGKIGLFKKDVKGREIYYFWYYKPDGTRAQKSTGQVVKHKALQVVSDLLADDYVFIQDHKLLFKQFAQDFWIKDTCPIYQAKLKRGKKLSSQYLIECRIVLDKYITPAFGNYKITAISPALIDTWLVNLPSSENLSHSRSVNFSELLAFLKIKSSFSGLSRQFPFKSVLGLARNGAINPSVIFPVAVAKEQKIFPFENCSSASTPDFNISPIRGST